MYYINKRKIIFIKKEEEEEEDGIHKTRGLFQLIRVG